jgi:hypothetical protein
VSAKALGRWADALALATQHETSVAGRLNSNSDNADAVASSVRIDSPLSEEGHRAAESQRMMGALKTVPADALMTRGPSEAMPRFGIQHAVDARRHRRANDHPHVLRVGDTIQRQTVLGFAFDRARSRAT